MTLTGTTGNYNVNTLVLLLLFIVYLLQAYPLYPEISNTLLVHCRWSSEEDLVKEVELIESELCAPVFPVFLHFLYHGTVFVNTSTALPLLMLADKYNVQPLKTSCEEYVYSQVCISILIRKRRLLICLMFIQIHIFADIDKFFSQKPLQ